MGKKLPVWAWSKVPQRSIREAALNNATIEVHGVYPTVSIERFTHYKACANTQYVDFTSTSKKRLNYVRPTFSWVDGGNTLIVKVTPGRDYLCHYAGIIRYCLHQYRRTNLLTIYRYPEVEHTLDVWTTLDDPLIVRDSVVIIGYVEEAENYLAMHLNRFFFAKREENEYYISAQYYTSGGQSIIFLGVKYSFWGNISAVIASKLCELHVKEIIYISKLGSLRTPNDVYNAVFAPTKYITMNYCNVTNITSATNNIASMFPELNTQCHASVPTVIEEDFIQREVLINHNVSSIDNEISQIAYAVSDFNKKNQRNVCFSSLHFASDYLREATEINHNIEHDLSNHRSTGAIKKKVNIMRVVLLYLHRYVQTSYP
ncbi:MAG: hypothetical protein MUC61_02830 [Amoebophilaceae bacterium]|jgi:hypothetical protein|nr:hypothetical protein [Amoebophilaceae bacterium]